MTTADERRIMAALRRAQVLADAPPDAMRRVASSSQILTFRARRVVYLPSDRSEGIFFLGTGLVKVSRVTHDGKELTIAYREVGDYFGESALVETGAREEMAEAREPTTAVEIPRTALDRLLGGHPPTALRFVRSLIARRRVFENRVERIVFRDVGSKLSELMLSLASSHGAEDSRGVSLGLKITHQEMANLIGSTRETVSLTLSQFKRRGLIATEGRRIIITDRESLRAIS